METDRDINSLDAEALADVHERARAKLAAARAAPVEAESWAARTLPEVGRYAAWLAAVATPVVVLTIWPPELFDIRDPATWLIGPWPFLTAAWAILLGCLFVKSESQRRGMDPAERAVRSYFADTAAEVRVAFAAWRVLEADFDATFRRPPGLTGDITVPPVIADAELHRQYWKGLSNPGWRTHTGWVVKSVELLHVADDLRLALVSLDVARRRGGFLGPLTPNESMWMVWAGIPVAIFFRQEPWYVLLAAMFAAAFVAHCLGRLFATKPEPHRIRKLVVHSGGKWRMFNAEWEGWEEIDLSWLDNDRTVR